MINLPSIYSANVIGLLIMIVLLLSRGWKIQTKNSESKNLLILIIAVIIACVVDPIVFYFDGRPGALARYIILLGNTVLFSLNAILGPAYITLIDRHINEHQSFRQRLFLYAIIFLELFLLFVNLFKPIIFGIHENNEYYRLPLYWLYVIMETIFLLYGQHVYYAAKRRGRFLSFFPTWQFLVPITIGMLGQSFFYGISLIWPCVGVSVCCIALSLQNENIYLDMLTGTFNRFYLNEIIASTRKSGEDISAMMLDMNGFKSINDTYSHVEGDNALIAMTEILNRVVCNNGVVIRFAGDEFIIILDKTATHSIAEYKDYINKAIDHYNSISDKPYKLSASMGGGTFNLSTNSDFDLVSEIDKLMYADKALYYQKNNRRK
ncbi:diguanylate cyclase domain-containing protein [Butyrivibrio sp. JL13D10]|uniref:GGDEF domain-containing protein n=1 Tax=Butyrivibrio sp. JL13D10 TaxID=3236815 RepID=UPI0038B42759